MTLVTFLKILIVSAIGIAGAGWSAHVYIADQLGAKADKEYVIAMNARQQFYEDRQMSALVREIAYYEQKKDKKQSDWETLRWLREQLAEMQRVRRGK